MRTLKLLFLLLLTGQLAVAQGYILNAYVQQGLDSNQAIKQQNFQLTKNLYALKESTGLFFPDISLQANYLDSRGGRSIDIPVGDLMNPVYQNLNAINAVFAPGSPQYPTISNVSEQLNPKNFYNAYFQASLPLINAEVWYNRSIKKDQVALQQNEVAIYKRELVKDIKLAYFNYLKAVQAVRIYEAALALVKESERVNQKLVENGKEVAYVLSRAKSEVNKIEAKLTDAQNTKKNAAAYFNFLINKPLDSEITVDETLLNNLQPLPSATSVNAGKREELVKLGLAKKVDQHILSLQKSAWIPKVGAQLNLGSQSSDFKFNSSSRYYLLGLSFDWHLFNGLRDVHRIKQAQVELQALNAQTQYVENQLELAATAAGNSYTSASAQYESARQQEQSSAEYFGLMNKKYKEGQALYIEFLDARNETTLASLQKSISYFDAWIKYAELERAVAGASINQ